MTSSSRLEGHVLFMFRLYIDRVWSSVGIDSIAQTLMAV